MRYTRGDSQISPEQVIPSLLSGEAVSVEEGAVNIAIKPLRLKEGGFLTTRYEAAGLAYPFPEMALLAVERAVSIQGQEARVPNACEIYKEVALRHAPAEVERLFADADRKHRRV